jgi:xylulokinase
MLETQDKKITTSEVIRFVGGGALSDVMCQILADCTGKTIETVASPQNTGSMGAAAVAAVGCGVIESLAQAKQLIPAVKAYTPSPAHKAQYDKHFAIYKQLHRANKSLFQEIST